MAFLLVRLVFFEALVRDWVIRIDERRGRTDK